MEVFNWMERGSCVTFSTVRLAIVSIAELYAPIVLGLTKGVEGEATSDPGLQHGVSDICRGVGYSRKGVEETRLPMVSMAVSFAGL